MTPQDPKDLAQRWLTEDLNAEERRSLMETALEDQELFDQLAAEDELRLLLADPSARQAVLDLLQPEELRTAGVLPRGSAGIAPWATGGALAAAVILVFVGISSTRTPIAEKTIAMQRQPADTASPAATSVAAPESAARALPAAKGRLPKAPPAAAPPVPERQVREAAPAPGGVIGGVIGGVPGPAALMRVQTMQVRRPDGVVVGFLNGAQVPLGSTVLVNGVPQEPGQVRLIGTAPSAAKESVQTRPAVPGRGILFEIPVSAAGSYAYRLEMPGGDVQFINFSAR